LSRDISILHQKAGAGDATGQERWIGGLSFEKSSHLTHLLIESPGKRAFPAFAGTSSEPISALPLRHAFF